MEGVLLFLKTDYMIPIELTVCFVVSKRSSNAQQIFATVTLAI